MHQHLLKPLSVSEYLLQADLYIYMSLEVQVHASRCHNLRSSTHLQSLSRSMVDYTSQCCPPIPLTLPRYPIASSPAPLRWLGIIPSQQLREPSIRPFSDRTKNDLFRQQTESWSQEQTKNPSREQTESLPSLRTNWKFVYFLLSTLPFILVLSWMLAPDWLL